jgi:hypothetical protein
MVLNKSPYQRVLVCSALCCDEQKTGAALENVPCYFAYHAHIPGITILNQSLMENPREFTAFL